MNKRNITIIGVLAAVLVVGSIVNRWGDSSDAPEAAEVSTTPVTVRTDQGTWSTSDKIPTDFPSDVPVYPGASVQGSLSAPPAGDSSGGHYVGLQTSDASATVVAWYKKEIAAQGWKIQTNATSGGSVILSATKDTRTLSVTVTSEGADTSMSLVVANQ